MDIYVRDGSIIVSGVSCFDLARSCDCGQAFRWKNTGNGWFGVAGGRGATVRQTGETLIITPGKDKDVGFWLNYFDLYRNYQAIEDEVRCDATLGKCLDYASGIHIFNQDPFETLISFIISANNNIKRITGIVDRLCILAGEKHEGTTEYYSFPAPEAIAELTVEQLTAIGSGYRAPYIKDSAKMIADGYGQKRTAEIPGSGAKGCGLRTAVLTGPCGRISVGRMDEARHAAHVLPRRRTGEKGHGGPDSRPRPKQRHIATIHIPIRKREYVAIWNRRDGTDPLPFFECHPG